MLEGGKDIELHPCQHRKRGVDRRSKVLERCGVWRSGSISHARSPCKKAMRADMSCSRNAMHYTHHSEQRQREVKRQRRRLHDGRAILCTESHVPHTTLWQSLAGLHLGTDTTLQQSHMHESCL